MENSLGTWGSEKYDYYKRQYEIVIAGINSEQLDESKNNFTELQKQMLYDIAETVQKRGKFKSG